jgi:hypothetical protein
MHGAGANGLQKLHIFDIKSGAFHGKMGLKMVSIDAFEKPRNGRKRNHEFKPVPSVTATG